MSAYSPKTCRVILSTAVSGVPVNPTNVAFGGPDLKTLIIASLCGWSVHTAPVAVPGLPVRYPAADWWTSYSSLDLADEAFADDALLAARSAWRTRPSRGTAIDPWQVVAVGSLAQPYKGYDGPEQFVEIAPGDGSRCIARKLVEAGVVRDE